MSMTIMSMTIKELISEVHMNARCNGWWPAERLERIRRNDPDTLGAVLALIHSEVSEALECVRNSHMEIFTGDNDKPEGFHVELADAVIRIFDLVGAMDDADAFTFALDEKIAHNRTRPHRHGNKNL